MYRAALLILCGFVVVCASNDPPTCADNEVSTQCTSKCQDTFCQTYENQNTTCLNEACSSDTCCVCRVNFRRSANGTCIPTRSCPPFKCHGKHESYNSCPLYCPTDSCNYVNSGGKCPTIGRIGILLICNPRCTCSKGYWRNEAGDCVEAKECPNYKADDSPS